MAIPVLNHLDFRYAAEAQNLILHKTTEGSATNTEGAIIYDTGTDTVKYRNASAWVNLARVITAGGNTIDNDETLAFTAGTGITIAESGGAVTITNSAAAGSSFGTVVVSGQSDVVADQANDTLTLVAAGGMTITQVAGTDTITLTSADTTTNTMGSGFVIEDDDGTEVTITENKEMKIIGAGGLTTNWTDVSTGSDGDPYDLTLTIGTLNQDTTGEAGSVEYDLTVDNTTIKLNSGTTYDGSAARTISGKTAAIANAGTGLATADQIHTFVTTQTDATAAATTGQAGTVATIAGLAPNTATTQATQGAITSAAALATVGTITSGTWQATDVGIAYGGTGASSAAAAATALLATSQGGALTIGDGSDTITVPGDLTVTGTTTTNNVTTVSTSNGVVFEGTAADGHDGTLISVVAGADVTYTLPNVTGYVGLFAADPSTTTITSTPAELNTLDGFDGDVDDLKYAKDLYDTGVTAAEFDYLDGVTSAIQTQIDSKSPTTGHSSIATVGTIGTGTWAATDVAVTHGGTGSSNASDARTALGVAYSSAAAVLSGTATDNVVTPDKLAAKSVTSIILTASVDATELSARIAHNLGTTSLLVVAQLINEDGTTDYGNCIIDWECTTDGSTDSTNDIFVKFASAPPSNVYVNITSIHGATAITPTYPS